MGITKTILFTEEQNRMAGMAKALSHPARIAIIQHLLAEGTCINRHLVEETGLAQATISQHLKELKGAGLIKGTIEGTSMSYCLDTEGWGKFRNHFNDFLRAEPDNPVTKCC